MNENCGKIPSIESEKDSSGRGSGGVGTSTLAAHGVGGDPEMAEKVRRSVETLGAASRGESLKAHDATRVGGRESQLLQRWEYVNGNIIVMRHRQTVCPNLLFLFT